MKKTLIGITLVAATVLTAAVNVDAAKKADTNVGIGFKGDTSTTGGPYKGNLNLTHYPSDIGFGTSNIAADGPQAFPQVKAKDVSLNLVVLDDRADKKMEGEGDDKAEVDVKNDWNLTAEIKELKSIKDPSVKLHGDLELNFTQPKKYKVTDTDLDANGIDYVLPEPSTATENVDNGKYEFVFGTDFTGLNGESKTPVKVEIGAKTATKVMSTKQGEVANGGVATKIEGSKLKITSKQEKDTQYSGILNWTLNDTY